MKKFFSICMLFALVVSLTACGDAAEESPGTSDSGRHERYSDVYIFFCRHWRHGDH